MRVTLTIDLDVSEGMTITRADNGSIVIGPQEPPASSAPVKLSDKIKTRWRSQNPGSGAFELVDELELRGLRIVAPLTRKAKPVEPYLRAVGTTSSGIKLSAYINTEKMSISGASLVDAAAALPGASVPPKRERSRQSLESSAWPLLPPMWTASTCTTG